MKKYTILFLCTGNSCRSQMAEAWAKHLKPDQLTTYSAGVDVHGLNPDVVTIMNEVGIDISNYKSQHVDEFKSIHFDYVITVCDHANDVCPTFPTATHIIHSHFDDPSISAKKLAEKGASKEDQLNYYRKSRDQIKLFIDTLPDSLNTQKKGFFSRLIEKVDKKMVDKANTESCCGNKNNGGSSCC